MACRVSSGPVSAQCRTQNSSPQTQPLWATAGSRLRGPPTLCPALLGWGCGLGAGDPTGTSSLSLSWSSPIQLEPLVPSLWSELLSLRLGRDSQPRPPGHLPG